LVIAFSLKLKWFPPSGLTTFTDSPIEWLRTVTLPAIALGFLLAGQVTRLLRTEMIRQMGSNYVRTLWAKGLPARAVIGKHALRSAGSPALTVLGVQIGYLLGGTVIIEQIFAIPGIGSYLLNAILDRDIPVIQGVTMVFVFFQIGMSLLVDILYGMLNPKVRVS
jgi:peptide/nickel transport system permease protein